MFCSDLSVTLTWRKKTKISNSSNVVTFFSLFRALNASFILYMGWLIQWSPICDFVKPIRFWSIVWKKNTNFHVIKAIFTSFCYKAIFAFWKLYIKNYSLKWILCWEQIPFSFSGNLLFGRFVYNLVLMVYGYVTIEINQKLILILLCHYFERIATANFCGNFFWVASMEILYPSRRRHTCRESSIQVISTSSYLRID